MSRFRFFNNPRALGQWASIAGLSLCLAGAAVAQSADSLRPATGSEARFGTQMDIGHMSEPLLSIVNPHEEQLAVDVLALDEDGDRHRSHRLHLEAGGASLLGLQGDVQFERLILSAERRFAADVEDALSGETLAARVSPLGEALAKGFEADPVTTRCDGTWNLSCISPTNCNVVTGYRPGRVENGDQVYWNLNTPTGPWTTVGSGCWAVWYNVLSNGCPSRVVNCANQTYAVSHDLPPLGPDLVIEGITVTPNPVTSGDDVTVRYTVRNIGDTTVTARYRERILLQPVGGGASIEAWVVSSHGQDLPPNGTLQVVVSVEINAPAGQYRVQVEADSSRAITESDESNVFNGPTLNVQAPAGGQITLTGLTYRPSSSNGWTFSMHNCPQTVSCTRSFGVENTGTGPALFYLQDFSHADATVSHNCPTSLPVGATCSISISSTLPLRVAKRPLGFLKVLNAMPAESSYQICIADDNTLCR